MGLSCICGDEIGIRWSETTRQCLVAMGGGENPAEGVPNQLSDRRDLACSGLFGLLPPRLAHTGWHCIRPIVPSIIEREHRFGLGTDDRGIGGKEARPFA